MGQRAFAAAGADDNQQATCMAARSLDPGQQPCARLSEEVAAILMVLCPTVPLLRCAYDHLTTAALMHRSFVVVLHAPV